MVKSVIAAGVAVAIAARAVSAQAVGTYPNASSVALVVAQYNNSGLNYHIGSSQSFGLPLDATALLRVTYPGIGLISNGAAYTASQVASAPSVAVWPAQGANYSTTSKYTLMLADASALGDPDAQGEYRHYLANGVGVPASFNGSGAFNVTNGTVITNYAGPGPIAGTGAHRYAWLLFQQPTNFSAPANLSTAGVAPGHWSVYDYATSTHLGKIVAASFFTVQNGNPTASVVSTTAINTATLVVPTTTAGVSASSGINGAAAAGVTSTKPNSASSISGSVTKAAGAVIALFAVFATLF
ncbi:hypothetical protein EMMF5_003483 [Cystobasidiomycetes sp. EMM_F5]